MLTHSTWMGKQPCFGQQMRAKSQTSVGKLAVPPIQGVIHYCHRQSFFSPGLIDVAFLGWACHAGHLGRHAFEGIPEDAVCLQKTFKTGVGLTHSS